MAFRTEKETRDQLSLRDSPDAIRLVPVLDGSAHDFEPSDTESSGPAPSEALLDSAARRLDVVGDVVVGSSPY